MKNLLPCLKLTLTLSAVTLGIAALPQQAIAASWSDLTKSAIETFTKNPGSSPSIAGLSSEQITSGLKEALRVGSEKVIEQVGRTGGYLADPAIHIPLPENLNTVHQTLDKFGFGRLTKDLEDRINRAAEAAAPEAKAVFVHSIQAMTLKDAKQILDGPEDAATQYFKQSMSSPLTERFTPIIERSLTEVGAIQAFDQMINQYKSLPFVPDVKSDLTIYAVAKALDGLFYYMAKEEAAIRANPAARTTDILKKVFGAS